MAVKGAIASKYRNAGQTCVCANRILVQDGVYDAFTKRLAETAGAMKVADGFEPGAVIGPLIDMKAVATLSGDNPRAERFGRVGPTCRFKTDTGAIEIANDAPTLPSSAVGEG